MAAPHYTPTGNPAAGSAGVSSDLRTEFTAIETGIEVLNAYPLVGYFTDINTAGQIYIAVPWACTLETVYVVIETDNATADTGLTLKINGTAVTGGTGTILSTATEGDVITITPTALNVLTIGSAVEVETDGGGSGTVAANVTAVFART